MATPEPAPPPEQSKRSILSLTTLTERLHSVQIDQREYDLKNPQEFSIIEMERLALRLKRVLELHEADRDDDAQAEYTDLLSRTCRQILDAPTEIHDKLQDAQRVSICVVFSGLSLPIAVAMLGTRAADPSNPSKRPRGSRASTAARRITG